MSRRPPEVHQAQARKAGKVPRCGARWKPGSKLGLRRPCGKHATEEVRAGGSTVAYCPEHAADRARIEAERDAAEAVRTARIEERRRLATACVAGLEELLLPAGGDWHVPEDCEAVMAVRCACGDTLALDRFVDHFGLCAVRIDEEEQRQAAQEEAQFVLRAERVLDELERRERIAKAEKSATRLVPMKELAKYVWVDRGEDQAAEAKKVVAFLVEEGLVVTASVRGVVSVGLHEGGK